MGLDEMNKQKIAAFVLVVLMFAVFPITADQPIQNDSVKFIVSEWDHPDEYGQGIAGFYVKENSTGSFLNIQNPYTGIDFCYPENTTVYELNHTATTSLMFDVRVFLNYTELGLTHPDDFDLGINYIRLSIEMSIPTASLFSQQNFTYDSLGGLQETGIWWYSYEVVANVLLEGGRIYTIDIDYEIYVTSDEWEFSAPVVASGGNHTGTSTNNYTDTHSQDSTFYYTYDSVAPGATDVTLDFTVPSTWTISQINVSSYAHCRSDDGSATTKDITIWTGKTWSDRGDLAEDNSVPYDDGSTWVNWTGTNEALWNSTSGNVTIKFDVADSDQVFLYVDYVEIRFNRTVSQWTNIAEMEFVASVHIHEWGLNTAIIIIGLILIPASTIYLVKGGRDELSSDKFFYFLIMFFIGWALFIGVILP